MDYRNLSLSLSLVIFLFLFSGCQNKEPESSLEQKEEQNIVSQNFESGQEKEKLKQELLAVSEQAQVLGETEENLDQGQQSDNASLWSALDSLKDKIWNDLPKKHKDISTKDIRIRHGSIKNRHLQDGAVDSSKIENKSIKEKDLADEAISSLRVISSDLITTDKIKNGTILNEDISTDTKIDESKLNLSAYTLTNLPTDDEKSKLGELVDSSDSDIGLGDKNISNIHQQNTDTGTDSTVFTIGATGTDLSLQFGASSQALVYDDSESRFAFNQPLYLSSEKITGLATPTADADAATKGYVDTQLSTEINNLKWKDPVDAFVDLPSCGADEDGHARLVEDENWIYRCDNSDTTWHKVANVATVNHSVLQNRDAVDSHPASAITFATAGNISADDVQDALAELDNETIHLDPSSSQTITYGGAGVQTILKMNASQSSSPFKITDSSDSSVFTVDENGLVTTASINSSSIVNGSIAGGDLASNISVSTTGTLSASILALTIATGTAPMTISSTTKVSNLNADLLDGFNTSQTGGASTIPVLDASGNLILTDAKIETETVKFEGETTAPSIEEGKVYYDSNDKMFKLYNSQEDSYIEMVPNLPIQPTNCPDGYIPVPGNPLYGTAGGFCVMKYEAKCATDAAPTTGLITPTTAYNTYDNNTTACTSANTRGVVSLPDGYPIANISQTNAKTYCESLGTDYHLISNNEWMTIARNIEKQSSNWTSGTVGTDGIWRGHTDNSPATALEASSDDDLGYTGTEQASPSIEKRTFVLSNGKIIWDLSGNTWEWNSDIIEADQAPIDSTPISEYIEYTAIDDYQMMSYANTRPSNPNWNATQNMGRLYTDYDDGTAERAFRRGGSWDATSGAGVFALRLSNSPTNTNYNIGFRCVR